MHVAGNVVHVAGGERDVAGDVRNITGCECYIIGRGVTSSALVVIDPAMVSALLELSLTSAHTNGGK